MFQQNVSDYTLTNMKKNQIGTLLETKVTKMTDTVFLHSTETRVFLDSRETLRCIAVVAAVGIF